MWHTNSTRVGKRAEDHSLHPVATLTTTAIQVVARAFIAMQIAAENSSVSILDLWCGGSDILFRISGSLVISTSDLTKPTMPKS